MTFLLRDTDDKQYLVDSAVSYELVSEIGAACSGLRLYFDSDDEIGEIYSVQVKNDRGTLIFNGLCDLQRESRKADTAEYFIYARSTAAVLADNEAAPFEYKNPTARQLFAVNAKGFGFTCDLPDIYTENSYIVSKGTSCFGAVNNFVFMMTGRSVYVDESNTLKIYSESKTVKRLEDYDVISQSFTINRCDVISRVDYKMNASEEYKYHYASSLAQRNKIIRSRKMNLSGLPPLQRENAAKNKLAASIDNYYCFKVQLAGDCDFQLFDRVKTDKGEFLVYEMIHSKGEQGEETALVLKKKIDGELMNYVAE